LAQDGVAQVDQFVGAGQSHDDGHGRKLT
jgi:hypothetical protein